MVFCPLTDRVLHSFQYKIPMMALKSVTSLNDLCEQTKEIIWSILSNENINLRHISSIWYIKKRISTRHKHWRWKGFPVQGLVFERALHCFSPSSLLLVFPVFFSLCRTKTTKRTDSCSFHFCKEVYSLWYLLWTYDHNIHIKHHTHTVGSVCWQ